MTKSNNASMASGANDHDDYYYNDEFYDEPDLYYEDRGSGHQKRARKALQQLERQQFGGIKNIGVEFFRLTPLPSSKSTGARGSCVSAGNGCKRPDWLINVPITDGLEKLCSTTMLEALWGLQVAEGEAALVSANDGYEFTVSSLLLSLHSPVLEQLLLEQSANSTASSSSPPVCKLCLDEPRHEVALLLAAIFLPESEEVFNPRTAYTLARIARKYDMKRVLLMIGGIVILSNSSKWELSHDPPPWDDDRTLSNGRRVPGHHTTLSARANPQAAHTQQSKVSNEAWEKNGVMYFDKKCINSPQHVLQLLYLTQHTAHDTANKYMLELLASADSCNNDLYNFFESAEVYEFPELTQGIGLALAATCALELRKRYPIRYILKPKDSSQQMAAANNRHRQALQNRPEQFPASARRELVLRICVALYFYYPLFRHLSAHKQVIANDEVVGNAAERGPGELELHGSSSDTSNMDSRKTCHCASRVASPQTARLNSELIAKTANGDINLYCKRDNVNVRAHAGMLRQHSTVLRDMLSDGCSAAIVPITKNSSTAASSSTPAMSLPVDDSSQQWLATLAVIYPLNDDGGCPVDDAHSVLELADKYNMVAVKKRVLAHLSARCHLVGLFKGGADAKKMGDVLRLLSVCSTESLDLGSRMCATLLADDHLAVFFAVMVDVAPSKAPVLSPEAWWVVLKYLTRKTYR